MHSIVYGIVTRQSSFQYRNVCGQLHRAFHNSIRHNHHPSRKALFKERAPLYDESSTPYEPSGEKTVNLITELSKDTTILEIEPPT